MGGKGGRSKLRRELKSIFKGVGKFSVDLVTGILRYCTWRWLGSAGGGREGRYQINGGECVLLEATGSSQPLFLFLRLMCAFNPELDAAKLWPERSMLQERIYTS